MASNMSLNDIVNALRDGATADLWYDTTLEDDPETAERLCNRIMRIQDAMLLAADQLEVDYKRRMFARMTKDRQNV